MDIGRRVGTIGLEKALQNHRTCANVQNVDAVRDQCRYSLRAGEVPRNGRILHFVPPAHVGYTIHIDDRVDGSLTAVGGAFGPWFRKRINFLLT
jgi:hypothetical protein